MKADLSRVTFQPKKHFAGLIHQQQRVMLDADLNEQRAIAAHRVEQGAADEFGPCATPVDPATGTATGFQLQANAAQDSLAVGQGRLYVNGILCESEGPFPVHAQPDLPADGTPIVPGPGLPLSLPRPGAAAATKLVDLDGQGKPIPPRDGLYVGFVEVWRRHVTALEDDKIREVALGGPDTATRLKTLAQVKLLRVDPDPAHSATCATPGQAWFDHLASIQPTGKLAAQAEPTKPPKSPCVIAPNAGYRRLENQLYRVEIHQGGMVPGGVKLKWSRDNGSIVAKCKPDQAAGTDIKVTSLGRDAVLSVAAGKWVELVDDTHELLGLPGQLLEVQKAQDDVVTVKDVAELPAFPANPRLRRWDGVEDGKTTWTLLEDGIEVKLDAGTYLVGDHWEIPARTATGDIEWPEAESGNPLSVQRHGEPHHLCKLALLRCAAGKWSVIEDCRPAFPAVTDLVNLFYVGGDGHAVLQNLDHPGKRAALLLQVGVANGQWPVANAVVRFTVGQGGGVLQGAGNKVDRPTDGAGVATCSWEPDSTTRVQTVEAVLLEGGQPTAQHLPVRFTAQLLRAADVSYDPAACAVLKADGANTVQAAIDALCAQGRGRGCKITVGRGGDFTTLAEAILATMDLNQKQTDFCICLLAGEHATEGELAKEKWPPKEDFDRRADILRRHHLSITGCGRATRVVAREAPLLLAHHASVALGSFDLVGAPATQPLLALDDCAEVVLRDLSVTGAVKKRAALEIVGAQGFLVEGCLVEAYTPESLRPGKVIGALHIAAKALDTFGELAAPAYALALASVFDDAAEVPPQKRAKEAEAARKQLKEVSRARTVGPHELAAAEKLVEAWARPELDRMELLAALAAFRPAVALDHPALALVTGLTPANAALRASRFTGIVSLDGEGTRLADDDLPKASTLLRDAFGSERSALQLVENRFDHLLLGQGAAKRLGAKKRASGLYRRVLLDGNVITGSTMQLLCVHAHLGANLFGPVRQDGALVAASATILGNTDASFEGRVRFFSSGVHAPGDAGNVGLKVQVVRPP